MTSRGMLPQLGACLGALVVTALGASGQDVPTLSLDDARDMSGDGVAFVELVTERDTYFVHEEVRLRLRFGLEEAFREGSMIQPFRRPLDVPVQVLAPRIAELPGLVPVVPESAGPASRFALNDQVVDALRRDRLVADGKRYAVLEFEWTFRPETPGSLELPAPVVCFAYATSFREDFLNGRTPEDRKDAYVGGASLTLTIQPLPEEGRPPDFSGAVGRFTVSASVHPEAIVMGEGVELRLRVMGDGSLRFLAPPPMELSGFHVRGMVIEEDGEARVIKYDLAPRSTRVTAVPPVPFTFFDPSPPGTYDKIWAKALPLQVRPAAMPGVDDIFGLKPVPAGGGTGLPSRPASGWLLGALIAPWLVVGGVAVRRRVRRRYEPARVRARQAAATFRARAQESGADAAQGLTQFLAVCLDCPAPGVIGHDLAARLVAVGAPGDLARRIAQHLDTLDGARYGGLAPPDAAESTWALVEELERALANPEESR